MSTDYCNPGVDAGDHTNKIGTKEQSRGNGSLVDKGKTITLEMQDMPARSAPSLRPTGAKAPKGRQGHE